MHALLFDFIFEVDVLICNFVFDVIFVLIRDIVSHLIRYIKYFSNIHNYFCVFKHTYFFLFILKFPLHMWNNMSVCLCVFCVWLAKEKKYTLVDIKDLLYYIILYYIILYYICFDMQVPIWFNIFCASMFDLIHIFWCVILFLTCETYWIWCPFLCLNHIWFDL